MRGATRARRCRRWSRPIWRRDSLWEVSGLIGGNRPVIVKIDDAGMVQTGGGMKLAREQIAISPLSCALSSEDLHRRAEAEPLVASGVNGRHPAAAQVVLEHESTDSHLERVYRVLYSETTMLGLEPGEVFVGAPNRRPITLHRAMK